MHARRGPVEHRARNTPPICHPNDPCTAKRFRWQRPFGVRWFAVHAGGVSLVRMARLSCQTASARLQGLDSEFALLNATGVLQAAA